MIPKILFQTSKEKLEHCVVNSTIDTVGDKWTYLHFDDKEIVEFINQNPLPEFPDAADVFNNIKLGEHKADFFRYYFLYVRGGVFIDSDLSLRTSLDYYVNNYSFFTCESDCGVDCYFNGLLGAEPGNDIIYHAMVHAYNLFKNNTDVDYLTICIELKKIVLANRRPGIKILSEMLVTEEFGFTFLFDADQDYKLIAVHFQLLESVPADHARASRDLEIKFRKILEIYRTLLVREPDHEGFRNYLISSLSAAEIENSIKNSEEFLQSEKIHKKEIANLFWHGELTMLEITCIKSFVQQGFHTKLWSYNNLSVDGAESCDASLVLPKEKLEHCVVNRVIKNLIPRILLQVSKEPLPDHVIRMWKNRCEYDWQHHHFNDSTMIIQYFKDNPIKEFPNIIEVFNSFQGAHRVDLFRYYYIYQHGGIFADSDFMMSSEFKLEQFIESGCQHFLTITNSQPETVMFNGFFGAVPNSKFVYELLTHAYHTEPEHLEKYYMLFCHFMYKTYTKHKDTMNSTTDLYFEKEFIDGVGISFDSNNRVVGRHYYATKIIPDDSGNG
jgi:mannosyltransferase OCH1-like enzyme